MLQRPTLLFRVHVSTLFFLAFGLFAAKRNKFVSIAVAALGIFSKLMHSGHVCSCSVVGRTDRFLSVTLRLLIGIQQTSLKSPSHPQPVTFIFFPPSLPSCPLPPSDTFVEKPWSKQVNHWSAVITMMNTNCTLRYAFTIRDE